MNDTKKNITKKILAKLGKAFLFLGSSLVILSEKFGNKPLPHQKDMDNWKKINGDKTLRIDYELNSSSIVFDVGGYEGQWSSDIFAKYGCDIYIFEPVNIFSRFIVQRFIKNPKIRVYSFGLSYKSCEEDIFVSADSSSLYNEKSGSVKERVKLMKASEFFQKNDIIFIDLMKINIEGGEYELLQHLIESNIITKINNLQIQFHYFISDATSKRDQLRNMLKNTHELTYDFPWVWENWKRKNNDHC